MTLPADWQPTLIYDSYLLFEQNGRPAFEIKWKTIRGQFSPKRILRKLHRALKPAGTSVEPWPLPEQIPALQPDLSMMGFQWQGSKQGCRGLLLYCPHCERVTLLQVYGSGQARIADLESIMASFSDHSDSDDQCWSMYGLKARLPVQAKLLRHEFLIGRFELSFTLQGRTMTLYRFKPAATILANQSLHDFGAPLAAPAPCIEKEPDQVTWEQELRGLSKLLALLKRKPACTRLHLWHLQEKNAILGIKVTGKRSLARELVNKVTENFNVD